MAIWIGIDEAGYGPVLGPLVVAATAFHVPDGVREDTLWELVRDEISRWGGRRAADRIVIDDSKRVHTGGGLRALEETVLAFAGLSGEYPRHARALLDLLAMPGTTELAPCPWYEDLDTLALPAETTLARLVNLTAAVEAFGRPGTPCRFLGMRFIAVHPAEFNRMVRHTRNKSLVEFQKLGILLHFLWEHFAPRDVHVAVDKQGGRSHYLTLLGDVFPDAEFRVVDEEAERSCYRVRSGPREALIVFKPKADQTCLPVALASMLAKYVREVFMSAFNRYWSARVPGLAPTAGYPQDARRWLDEVAPVLESEPALRAAMIRER